MAALDWLVLAVYLAGITALGVWLGRAQKDAKDYFYGDGSIRWWAIMLSVVATETSSLTFISIPGLAYVSGLGFVQIAFGYLLGRIVVSATLLPLYFRGEASTAYTHLEQRFGTATRRVASVTFLLTRTLGDSVRVYATAIPLALILGPFVPAEWLAPVSILTLGALTLLYTFHGGMRAVVWTDVIQTAIYLLGAIAALAVLGLRVPGGWSSIFEQAGAAGLLNAVNLSFSFSDPHTLWAGLLGGGVLAMASHGADQLFVQRLLGAANLNDARKALIGSGVMVIAQMLLFLTVGAGLWVYYGGQTFERPDTIFPRFIVEQMPAGLVGLILAAILAAAMSTISGALQSLSATTLQDLLLPLRGVNAPKLDDAALLRWSRRLVIAWAIVLVGGALLYSGKNTPVATVALAIAAFTYGGLLGGFGLALLWPRARQRDAIFGMVLGMALTSLVVFAAPLSAFLPALKPLAQIAWPWHVLIGTALTFSLGAASSLTHPAPARATRPSPAHPVTAAKTAEAAGE